MFHFSLATLLLVQYLIGWHIPGVDDHGMKPSYAMTLHISIGMALVTLLALRLSWRLARPAAADGLYATSVGTHWQLYALIFATAVTGWLSASSRGWSNSPFFAVPLPMLGDKSSPSTHAIWQLHEASELTLLVFIAIHVAAAIGRQFIERVMQGLLPEARS